MKIKAITNWESCDRTEKKLLLWYFNNRKLTFVFFDTMEQLKTFVKYYKITGIKKAIENYLELNKIGV